MLVEKHIYDSYCKQIEKNKKNKKMMDVLFRCSTDLLSWGRRNSSLVRDAKIKCVLVPRVFNYGHGPYEHIVERDVWGLEEKNNNVLPGLDKKIKESFRILKKSGWQSSYSVLCKHYGSYIHGLESIWDNNYDEWKGAYLVYQRLNSSARIIDRYNNPDLFGPMVLHEGDMVRLLPGKRPWISLLKGRGLIG